MAKKNRIDIVNNARGKPVFKGTPAEMKDLLQDIDDVSGLTVSPGDSAETYPADQYLEET